jgi:hypothetical protein
MNMQGWDFYVSQAFIRQSNSQRVVRLLREMRCELRADRRVKDLKTAINRRAGSALNIESAGKPF